MDLFISILVLGVLEVKFWILVYGGITFYGGNEARVLSILLLALDVDGDVIMNHVTGETLTKVSVNTDSNVANATITIAGSTYIAPQAEKASTGELSKFKAEYLDNFNLWVEDGIVTEDIVIVQVDNWKDDVFADDYKLKTFDELEKYIQNNRHLPGVKSERLVKKEGYSIQEMNVSLLEKVEELFLYIIAQEKE